MAKKKKNKDAAPKRTRWSVTVLKPGPERCVIAGREIHDRQIITLPDEQKYIDGLIKKGLLYRIRRA